MIEMDEAPEGASGPARWMARAVEWLRGRDGLPWWRQPAWAVTAGAGLILSLGLTTIALMGDDPDAPQAAAALPSTAPRSAKPFKPKIPPAGETPPAVKPARNSLGQAPPAAQTGTDDAPIAERSTDEEETAPPPNSDPPQVAGSGAAPPEVTQAAAEVQTPRRPPRRRTKPGGLTGQSRQYDDLHCKTIQSQHGVRVPSAASLLEVDGDRLPISNLADLAGSPAPVLFLPKGKHLVKFRPNESPLEVTIKEDLGVEYAAMRAFFGVGKSIADDELMSRGARALDVHSAPFLLNLMGASRVAQEQWPAAERKFRRALRVNPLFGPAHLNLAKCLAQRKADEEAILELQLAEATNVGNVFRLAEGIHALRRQLKLPAYERRPVALELARYVTGEGANLSEEDRRLTALMEAISKYAVRESERGKILNNLGAHFAEAGRVELALDHYRSALGALKFAGTERFDLARRVLGNMSDACRQAGFEEAEEYRAMQDLVTP